MMQTPSSTSKPSPLPPRQIVHWQQVWRWKTLIPRRDMMRRWILRALQGREAEITVRFVDEAEGRMLNHKFRAKDYATNVLTFDYSHEPIIADVVICVPVLERQAEEQNKTFKAHLAHLLVHATLHARGFDHRDDAEAQIMEALETDIMVALKFDPPYADQADDAPDES